MFGPREYDESVGFPRLGMSLVGSRAVESLSGVVERAPIQFVREAELGPPELPERLPLIVVSSIVRVPLPWARTPPPFGTASTPER